MTCGIDGISNKLIKPIGNSVSYPLSIIINKSMLSGKLPNDIKIAKIIPLCKGKEKYLLSNYRPISILPCISKIFEKLMHKILTKFFF